MIDLHISVNNKIATFQRRDGDIVCGNSDYQIKFTFDEEWSAYENKIARFVFGGQFQDVEFTGDTCPVPILSGVTLCEVGVYAGELCTTTSAFISCKPSILCHEASPSVENDGYYANEARKYAEEAKEAAAAATESGATFTPSVAADGTLSWTNNKGLENPAPVNIKGPKGDTYTLTDTDKTEIAEQAVELIDGVPSYWQTHLDERVEDIRRAMETAGRNKSAFLFYTDAHWGYGSGMSPKLLKYLGKHTALNKTIFGGDFGNTYEYPDTGKTMDDWMNIMREWKLAVRDIPNHHSVVGNHDQEVTALATDKALYGFLFAPEETNDIVRGGDFFYYIDDVNEKTRYFYLDTGLHTVLSDEQCAFLVESLTSVPSGWHIVVVSHIWFVYESTSTPTKGDIPAHAQKILDLLDAYNARMVSSITGNSKTYDYDFSKCAGWVEFCIGGHTHVDHTFASTRGIPVILCQTDSKHLRGDLYEYKAGEITEASVSAIVADYDNKKIYIIRVGRGNSSEVAITWHEVSYTNVLPTALAADGVNVYNGKGWKENTRWSSSSNIDQTADGIYITGYIPISAGDTIYLKNITMPNVKANNCMVHTFKALDDTTEGNIDNANLNNYYNTVWGEDGNLIQFNVPASAAYKYIRIQCGGITAGSIITINEPIEA